MSCLKAVLEAEDDDFEAIWSRCALNVHQFGLHSALGSKPGSSLLGEPFGCIQIHSGVSPSHSITLFAHMINVYCHQHLQALKDPVVKWGRGIGSLRAFFKNS